LQGRDPTKWHVVECAECGSRFEARIKKGVRFCSRSCKSKANARRLADDPAYREKMRALALKNGNVPPHAKGAGHYHWRGGVTQANQVWRATGEYKAWRIAVYKRDGFKCQSCGHMSTHLHAHHLQPAILHPELRYDISNGITLCQPCHDKLPKYARH
jgi:hypothetical protein